MRTNLPDALGRLRDGLAAVRLELAVPGAEEARRARDDLVAQVDDYLLPRLAQMDAPALIVVGGSTGAGKSTLLNSLVGSVVSPAGVLRPTTRAPVLAFPPDDLEWFEGARVLPGLPRASGGEARPGTLQLAPVRAWLDGLAADAQARAALVRRTLRGALASLPARAAAVEDAAMQQLSAAAELRAEADAAYAAAGREVEAALRSGSLLRGEVLARWHEVVGTGDVMRPPRR